MGFHERITLSSNGHEVKDAVFSHGASISDREGAPGEGMSMELPALIEVLDSIVLGAWDAAEARDMIIEVARQMEITERENTARELLEMRENRRR